MGIWEDDFLYRVVLLFDWTALIVVLVANWEVIDDVVSGWGGLGGLVNETELIVVISTLPFKYVLLSFLKQYVDEPFVIL